MTSALLTALFLAGASPPGAAAAAPGARPPSAIAVAGAASAPMKSAAMPAPVGDPPRMKLGTRQVEALLEASGYRRKSFADRSVYAVNRGSVVRITDENARQVLGQPTLAAERTGDAVSQTAVPAALRTRFGEEAFALPIEFTALERGNDRAIRFHPILKVLDSLHYEPEPRKFFGRLVISLVSSNGESAPLPLQQEVPVMVAADGAELTPAQVRFRSVNEPQEIRVAVAAPAEPYQVSAFTALQDRPDSIEVPVRRPQIKVEPVNRSIRGFGLEETQIVVRIAEVRGRKGETVVLQPGLGTITPSPVVLSEDGTGIAWLRSAQVGESTLTATAAPFRDGAAIVKFQWPVTFAIAILLGGTAGAMLRRGARRRVARNLFVGVLAAFVLAAALAAGLHVEGWSTPAGGAGEALFFCIAALAGYAGSKGMALLARSPGG